MAWVDVLRTGNASSAVVPVGAVETLVANTIYVFVTTVANSLVSNVAASFKKCLRKWFQSGTLNSWCKSMLWVVAVLMLLVAWNAEIKVLTVRAGDKAVLWVF